MNKSLINQELMSKYKKNNIVIFISNEYLLAGENKRALNSEMKYFLISCFPVRNFSLNIISGWRTNTYVHT